MRARFWGVRGSIPAPGPETIRYGGNTSCVSVTTAGGELVILDMGTGVMHLGNMLMATAPFASGGGRATILLTHAHWDHIQGFPFFPPIFVPGNRFEVRGNARSAQSLAAILEGQMNPHYSPIHTIKNLGADIEFEAARAGERFRAGELEVAVAANPHGSTTALAFRLEWAGRSLVYAPDAGYPGGLPPAASAELYRGADVLIHDCTYTPEDQADRLGRGQSSLLEAARTAAAAAVGRLVLFHYDQDYSDDAVDRVVERTRAALAELGSNVEVIAAREGLEIEI